MSSVADTVKALLLTPLEGAVFSIYYEHLDGSLFYRKYDNQVQYTSKKVDYQWHKSATFIMVQDRISEGVVLTEKEQEFFQKCVEAGWL